MSVIIGNVANDLAATCQVRSVARARAIRKSDASIAFGFERGVRPTEKGFHERAAVVLQSLAQISRKFSTAKGPLPGAFLWLGCAELA